MTIPYALIKAVELIRQSDGLIIAAGAGMGVDSGLPDFRGNAGFWRHYPALQKAGIDFQDMASPPHFRSSPGLAWGFYGHRLALYRDTQPHVGFQILRDIAQDLAFGSFVFTSNVDGQFQKAGFTEDQVYECHGSIHHLQCIDPCHDHIWAAHSFEPVIDNESCQLLNGPPTCPACGLLARPNVLMFNDTDWLSHRSDIQGERLSAWLRNTSNPVVIELGAGISVATVRYFSESLHCPLIRINPREAHIPETTQNVSLQMGALQALELIRQALRD